jgi:hypothetical protein
MSKADTIRDRWTDDNGNWRKGYDNAITAPMIVEAEGGDPTDKRDVAIAQMAINDFIVRQLLRRGIVAGGIERCPRKYMIAANALEEKVLGIDCIRKNQGRIRNMRIRTRKISGVGTRVTALLEYNQMLLDKEDSKAV